MSHLNEICRALDFAEEHLTQEIIVADMAAAASYSLYHFSRTFNRIVHLGPYDYLIRRRLSESARQLLESDRKIIDIAFDFQFNSPETYSRAFKRMFRMQPSQLRARREVDERFLLPRLTRDYLEHVNRGDHLKPTLESVGAMRLVGVMGLVKDDPQIIPKLWQVLARELEQIGLKGCAGEAYGVSWYPDGWSQEGFLFLAGVEAPSRPVEDSPLVVKNTGVYRCARFVHNGTRGDLRHSWNYIFQSWLPRSGERVAYPMEIERHGAGWDVGSAVETESEWELLIPIV
jgi:AraC family transcriptional regulator